MKTRNEAQEGAGEIWLTTADVCVLANVTKPAVHQWFQNGKLAAIQVGQILPSGGRMRLFRASEVHRFLEERAEKLRRGKEQPGPKTES